MIAAAADPVRGRPRRGVALLTPAPRVADVDITSPADMAEALRAVGYLPDDGVATAAFLADAMKRPLFCEGEPGTGKTALAAALARALDLPLIRLQCHEGIDASQALYDWDFPRQILHLRAAGECGRGGHRRRVAESSLYDRAVPGRATDPGRRCEQSARACCC